MEHGPVLGQIYVQLSYAAMYLLSRVVLHQGMSHYLYVFFRQADVPPGSGRSAKPSLRDLGKIFVLAILGITVSQNLYFAGLSLTSTTLATTMYCMYPAITFIFTLVFRMEKLELSELRGRAKLLGTLLCVGGAVFMTLFKGPVIFGYHSSQHEGLSLSVDSSWILGGLLLAGGVCTWSSCFIYQAWITLDCTSQLTTTAVMCWMGALQSGLLALLFVQTPDAWRLGWDLQLLTITYSGVFCSAIGLFVILWCVEKKGPLFTSVFSPLCNVIVAIFEPILLHVPFCWGSLAGMILVIGGLYIVVWGKTAEENVGGVGEVVVSGNTTDCDYSEPLLISGGDEAVKV
ncbi:WAT1-related protein At5g07050-like isoform X2 [Wolffia australiana]